LGEGRPGRRLLQHAARAETAAPEPIGLWSIRRFAPPKPRRTELFEKFRAASEAANTACSFLELQIDLFDQLGFCCGVNPLTHHRNNNRHHGDDDERDSQSKAHATSTRAT
jgi:hypothetical protein